MTAKYPVAPGPENTALWGASYGGVAAVNILVHRPELFGRMIVESPSVHAGNGQILRDTMGLVVTPARIAVGIRTKEESEDAINAGFLRGWKQLVDNPKNAQIAPQV